MDEKPRATKEERQKIKDEVLKALSKNPEWSAKDAGEVLLSVGSAMLKASCISETEFLEYARKTWAAQKPAPGPVPN